jgi:hypothetical protein
LGSDPSAVRSVSMNDIIDRKFVKRYRFTSVEIYTEGTPPPPHPLQMAEIQLSVSGVEG